MLDKENENDKQSQRSCKEKANRRIGLERKGERKEEEERIKSEWFSFQNAPQTPKTKINA